MSEPLPPTKMLTPPTPRTFVSLAGWLALLLLVVYPPWVVTQGVELTFAPAGQTNAVPNLRSGPVPRVVGEVGHQWLWVALGSKPASAHTRATPVSANVMSSWAGLSHSGLSLGLDVRLLLTELGVVLGAWALLLVKLPKAKEVTPSPAAG